MAITVDKSRPSAATKLCARSEFTQPTPRVMDRGFVRKMDVVETHIPNLSVAVTPVNNTADGAAQPIVDFDAFFLPLPDGDGGGGAPAPAEPTITIGGVGTAAATITFTLPPGTVCDSGRIDILNMSVNGGNRDLDQRSEPLTDPAHYVGWFGNGGGNEAPVAGLTADELAALWNSGGTFPGNGTVMTSTAAGNVVTLTETGGGLITDLRVTWAKE